LKWYHSRTVTWEQLTSILTAYNAHDKSFCVPTEPHGDRLSLLQYFDAWKRPTSSGHFVSLTWWSKTASEHRTTLHDMHDDLVLVTLNTRSHMTIELHCNVETEMHEWLRSSHGAISRVIIVHWPLTVLRRFVYRSSALVSVGLPDATASNHMHSVPVTDVPSKPMRKVNGCWDHCCWVECDVTHYDAFTQLIELKWNLHLIRRARCVAACLCWRRIHESVRSMTTTNCKYICSFCVVSQNWCGTSRYRHVFPMTSR